MRDPLSFHPTTPVQVKSITITSTVPKSLTGVQRARDSFQPHGADYQLAWVQPSALHHLKDIPVGLWLHPQGACQDQLPQYGDIRWVDGDAWGNRGVILVHSPLSHFPSDHTLMDCFLLS